MCGTFVSADPIKDDISKGLPNQVCLFFINILISRFNMFKQARSCLIQKKRMMRSTTHLLLSEGLNRMKDGFHSNSIEDVI